MTTLSAPSKRTATERQVAFAVEVAHTDALAKMCETIHRQAVSNSWPKQVVKAAIEHYGGPDAVEFWEEWLDS